MFYRRLSLRSPLFLIHLAQAALLVVLLQPVSVTAAALGEASVRSALGQRLEAELEIASLSATEAASVSVKLAPTESWTGAGIELIAIHRSLHLSIDRRDGRPVVRISSDQPVNEPFMHLLVELSADGVRTIRQYVLLIDPPVMLTAPVTAAGAATSTANTTSAQATPNARVEPSPHHRAARARDTTDTTKPSPADTAGAERIADQADRPTHRVKRGETLHSIARQAQPEGVQLEQMMAALLSHNPDAFVGNNMHRLRSGSQLIIPTVEETRLISPEQARQTLRVQTTDFLRYQQLLAERSASVTNPARSTSAANTADTATATATAAPTTGSANLQTSGGNVTVKMTEPAPPPIAQDKLTLSSPGAKEAVATQPNTQQAVESVAADKALVDANTRIATLEKNISEMQALLQMKSRALSEAQQRAAQSTRSDPATPPTPSPTPADQLTQLLLPPDPLLAAGVGVGLLLLALLWRWQRQSGGRNAERVTTPVEPTLAQTVIGAAGGRQIDTAHSVFHSNFVPSVSQIDMNEVDAVAEADVYIAYGRAEQAEEILLDALRAHPERHALRVKLLEIYAARDDRQRFGTLAAELRVLTHGMGSDWERAAQLGQSLEPDNYLYSAPLNGSVAAQEHATAQPSGVTSSGLDFSLEPISVVDAVHPKLTVPVTQGPFSSAVLNTKLELALACREIGDHAGARELLAEVAHARDPELARRAQTLLQQLA